MNKRYSFFFLGAYRCEPIKDFSWALLSVPIFGFHMYYILQATGMVSCSYDSCLLTHYSSHYNIAYTLGAETFANRAK